MIALSRGYMTKRESAFTAFSNAITEGIEVLPRSTIQAASARAMAGKIN